MHWCIQEVQDEFCIVEIEVAKDHAGQGMQDLQVIDLMACKGTGESEAKQEKW